MWLLPLAALACPAAAAPSAKADSAKDAWAAERRAEPQPEPRPALWLLADEDTRIYMFGTIHKLSPGFRWRSAALDKAVGEAAELVVETYEPPGSVTSAEEMAGYFSDEAVPILKRVPKKKRKPLKAAIKASGLPLQAFNRMHSWAAASTLGTARMLEKYGVEDVSGLPGVEDVLEETFRAADKPIRSVEDGNAVRASMSALPERIQTELLLESIAPLAGGDGDPSEPGVSEADWVAGRPEALDLEHKPGFSPELFEAVVRRRNAAWTEWLEERLKTPGTLLFAVGAGHLAGRESIQAMLARRGLSVKRID